MIETNIPHRKPNSCRELNQQNNDLGYELTPTQNLYHADILVKNSKQRRKPWFWIEIEWIMIEDEEEDQSAWSFGQRMTWWVRYTFSFSFSLIFRFHLILFLLSVCYCLIDHLWTKENYWPVTVEKASQPPPLYSRPGSINLDGLIDPGTIQGMVKFKTLAVFKEICTSQTTTPKLITGPRYAIEFEDNTIIMSIVYVIGNVGSGWGLI